MTDQAWLDANLDPKVHEFVRHANLFSKLAETNRWSSATFTTTLRQKAAQFGVTWDEAIDAWAAYENHLTAKDDK